MNASDREIEPPKFHIKPLEKTKTYNMKFDLDLNDMQMYSDNPPQTTAKSWTVFDVKKMINVRHKNIDLKLEIASMTKIMTIYTCCKILYGDMQCVNLNPKKVYFRASYLATRVKGYG